ncbi:MAG: restriction endonuclease [Chloroflexia bacterium]
MSTLSFEHLTETEFEEFCYDLLCHMGFRNVNWRKGTGLATSPADSGRDIECELAREEIGNQTYYDIWFVECKHYKNNRSVPREKLLGALSAAMIDRPDRLLFIVSSFLSNSAKDSLERFSKETRPAFKIWYWELTKIEELLGKLADKNKLLQKYRLGVPSDFTSQLHPAHVAYLRLAPTNTLSYVISTLDLLESDLRDRALSWVYRLILQPQLRDPTSAHDRLVYDALIAEPRVDQSSYAAFRQRCFDIQASGFLNEHVLAHFIISFALQNMLAMGDVEKTTSTIDLVRSMLRFPKDSRFRDGTPKEETQFQAETLRDEQSIASIPSFIYRNREIYVKFCEAVLPRLQRELYHDG